MWGWCIGCNPPSVVCGIRLIGLPAPSGRFFIGDCLPFPLAGRPFHRFHAGGLDITKCVIAISGWTFRFCSVAKPLGLPHLELQFYMWAEFPQSPNSGTDGHAPTHQPKTESCMHANKHTQSKAVQ